MTRTKDQAAVLEWCRQAQKLVSYPQDFGLRRSQVAGLATKLAEETGMLQLPRTPAAVVPALARA